MTHRIFLFALSGLILGGVAFAATLDGFERAPLTYGVLLAGLVALPGFSLYALQQTRSITRVGRPRHTPEPPDLTERLLEVYERGKRLDGEERQPFEAHIVAVCAALERGERIAAERELNKAEGYL